MTERLSTNLRRRAIAWAGQLTSLARSYAPAHVAPAISSHVEDKNDGEYIIRITADRAKAPDARAQEFGSGLHAKRGPKKTYVIAPKPPHKVLAFPWEAFDLKIEQYGFEVLEDLSRHKFRGFSEDGRYLFNYVDHPGIEAANDGQGYIAPAMKELKARARADLTKEIRDAIVGDLREAFGRKTA